MDLRKQVYPFAYFRGRATTFTRSESFTSSYFGGPHDVNMSGPEHGPSHIHHIATISNRDLGVPGYEFGFSISFFYGMSFEGCDLHYRRTHTKAIEITAMDPLESSPFWPYDGYPPLLPYIPLKVDQSAEMTLESFSEDVMQGLDGMHDDVLAFIVPPNPLMGVSLWGPSGDAEDVQVIFKYDIVKGIAHAYNACT